MKLPPPSDLNQLELIHKSLSTWLYSHPRGGSWGPLPKKLPDAAEKFLVEELSDEFWTVEIEHGTDYWGDVPGAHGLPKEDYLRVTRKI